MQRKSFGECICYSIKRHTRNIDSDEMLLKSQYKIHHFRNTIRFFQKIKARLFKTISYRFTLLTMARPRVHIEFTLEAVKHVRTRFFVFIRTLQTNVFPLPGRNTISKVTRQVQIDNIK